MAYVAAHQKQSLLSSRFLFLSQARCAKKACEDRLCTKETLFSPPQWLSTFWKSPRYNGAVDFKHCPNSFSLSSRSTGCVFIILHHCRNGTLLHALSPWHSDTYPTPPLSGSVSPPFLYYVYDWNWWISVFIDPLPPLVVCMYLSSLVMLAEFH